MSELSDVSTEHVATTRSPTDNTMMVGVTEKPAASSSFSEKKKNTLENFFPITMEQKQKPRKKKRTMTSKMTLDLKSASIVRLKMMTDTPIEGLALWTNLV